MKAISLWNPSQINVFLSWTINTRMCYLTQTPSPPQAFQHVTFASSEILIWAFPCPQDDRGWDGWMASLTRCESEWTLGVGDGQGGPACCNSWGRKESDTTEQLNWTELNVPKKEKSQLHSTVYVPLIHTATSVTLWVLSLWKLIHILSFFFYFQITSHSGPSAYFSTYYNFLF